MDRPDNIHLQDKPNLVNMQAVVKRWGGSMALRIAPEDARRLGLRDGMHVEVDITPPPVDLATLPTVRGGGDDAERHDELLHARDRH